MRSSTWCPRGTSLKTLNKSVRSFATTQQTHLAKHPRNTKLDCRCVAPDGSSSSTPSSRISSSSLQKSSSDGSIVKGYPSTPDATDPSASTSQQQATLNQNNTNGNGSSSSRKTDEGQETTLERGSWPWWTAYFNCMDDAVRELEGLEAEIDEAVKEEDFGKAAALQAQIRRIEQSDAVDGVLRDMDLAIQEERYADAATLRDVGGVGLLGWWVGKGEDGDEQGHLIRITPDFGRYVAHAYTARDVAAMAGWSGEGGDGSGITLVSEAMMDFDAKLEGTGDVGAPVFEVFIKKEDDTLTGIIQQPAALHAPMTAALQAAAVDDLSDAIVGQIAPGARVISVQKGTDENGQDYVRINLSPTTSNGNTTTTNGTGVGGDKDDDEEGSGFANSLSESDDEDENTTTSNKTNNNTTNDDDVGATTSANNTTSSSSSTFSVREEYEAEYFTIDQLAGEIRIHRTDDVWEAEAGEIPEEFLSSLETGDDVGGSHSTTTNDDDDDNETTTNSTTNSSSSSNNTYTDYSAEFASYNTTPPPPSSTENNDSSNGAHTWAFGTVEDHPLSERDNSSNYGTNNGSSSDSLSEEEEIEQQLRDAADLEANTISEMGLGAMMQRSPASIEWQGRDAFVLEVSPAPPSSTDDDDNDDDDSNGRSGVHGSGSVLEAEFEVLTSSNGFGVVKDKNGATSIVVKSADADDAEPTSVAINFESSSTSSNATSSTSSEDDDDLNDVTIDDINANIQRLEDVARRALGKAIAEGIGAVGDTSALRDLDRLGLEGRVTYTRVSPESVRTDPLTGVYIGSFGPHGPELLQLTRERVEGEDWVFGRKLTGDANVPSGEVSFKAQVGKGSRVSTSGVYPPEFGVLHRYMGQGRVAQEGYRNPKWVEGELLTLTSNNPLSPGATLGFVFNMDGARRYLVLFTKVHLDELPMSYE